MRYQVFILRSEIKFHVHGEIMMLKSLFHRQTCLLNRHTASRLTSTSFSSNSTKDASKQDNGNKSIKDRLKHTVKVYGVTATIFHSTVYVCSLSAVYVGVRNGLNAQELLTSWGVDTNILPDGAGDIAAAWAITAVTGPARGLLTIIGTPFVAKMVPGR